MKILWRCGISHGLSGPSGPPRLFNIRISIIWFLLPTTYTATRSRGGLEIAVSDSPAGPFRGWLGRPLIGEILNGAQPIDAHLFQDDDGTVYLYYGGWGHCNAAILNDRMDGFQPLSDGQYLREITPERYVEGPCMIKRWAVLFPLSTGQWAGDDYAVLYGSFPFAAGAVSLHGDCAGNGRSNRPLARP